MKKSPVAIALASALPLSLALSLVSTAATAQGSATTTPPSSAGQSFLDLDSDLDGKLTQDEASKSPVLKDQFTQADSNQDGGVDAVEFSAFVAKSDTSPQGGMQGSGQMSFESLDMNKDGSLNQSEAQVHSTLYQQYTSADLNQDGRIDQSEFSAFETKQSGQSSGAVGGQTMNFEQLDTNKDGWISSTEARSNPQVAQQYTTIDSNKDGWISKQEYQSRMGGQSPGAGAQTLNFDQLDVNKDSFLSSAEVSGYPQIAQKYTTIDSNKDGWISKQEYQSGMGASSSGMGGGQSMSFEQLDINKDSYLSSAEVSNQPQIAQQYTTIDSNKDGWISKQEYQASVGGRSGQAGASSFDSLDTNRDGSISLNEANVDPMLSQQFVQYDKDQNGSIDESEFSAFEASQGSGGMSPQPSPQ